MTDPRFRFNDLPPMTDAAMKQLADDVGVLSGSRPSFDDPKPVLDKRIMQTIYLRPSIKAKIDRALGKLSRSEWIEKAVLAALNHRGNNRG